MSIEPGTVYWITGLAGAGKTTIAKAIYAALRDKRENVVFLDGDLLRIVFGNDLGHDAADRRISAGRNSRLCKMLSDQGQDVVCATISLFHETHDWNRAQLTHYREIFLDVPMDVLRSRDQKGLYSRAQRGEVKNVMGVDVAPELPKSPDVTVANDGSRSPEDIARDCLQQLGAM